MRLRRKFLAQYELQVANGMDPSVALAQLECDAPLIAAYVRSHPSP